MTVFLQLTRHEPTGQYVLMRNGHYLQVTKKRKYTTRLVTPLADATVLDPEQVKEVLQNIDHNGLAIVPLHHATHVSQGVPGTCKTIGASITPGEFLQTQ